MKTGKNGSILQKKSIQDRKNDVKYHPLDMDSRYVDSVCITGCTEGGMQLHSHSFYEILYCRSSGDVEYLVGSDRYRLQKGDVVLITPDVSHCPILPDNAPEPYIRDMIRISPELIAELGKLYPGDAVAGVLQTRLLRTADTRWEFLDQLFRWCVTEADLRTPGWEYAVLGHTLQILVNLYRAMVDKSASAPQAEKPELLDQVLLYVEGRLARKITLADVAHQFFVSESTISQTFRNRMGVSFYRYVTQRRLIAAKHLIAEGVSMESVGRQVGFSDYSTFYRAFRQEYGIAPRQYRKMLEEATERGD